MMKKRKLFIYKKNECRQGVKPLFVIFASIVLMCVSMLTFAEVYHQETESQVLGNGIEYFKRLSFDADGWTQIHYYKVNLASPDVKVKLLYDDVNGLSTRQKLSDLVSEKTVGAVNGDYFALATPSTTIGLAIDEGNLLATPSNAEGFSSLVIENNVARIFKEYSTTELIHNGLNRIPIESYNRIHNKFYKTVVLDRKWGSKSIGVSSQFPNMMEIVIRDGIVQEIRNKMPAIEIKEGMQVVVANDLNRDAFLGVAVGDSLVMNLSLRIDPSQVTMGVGGGCRLIQNGVKVPFLQDLSARHPRTAFGISDVGQTLYLVTFDGRSQGYKGMNGNELAAFFIELGCSDAMILDGGGSTTFFKKSLGDVVGQVINYLSDGTQRKIVTGIAIENLGESGILKGLEMDSLYDEKVAVGSSIPFTLKGYDEAYQAININPSGIQYALINGEGMIKDNRFYPSRAGDALIRGSYQDKFVDILVTAYENFDRIAFEADKVQIKTNQEHVMNVYAYTRDGFKIQLAPVDLVWKDLYQLGYISAGRYTATQVGETIVEAQFSGFKTQTDIKVGTDQIIYDEFEQGGLSYTGSSSQVTYEARFDSNAYSGSQALAIDYTFLPDAKNRAVYINFDKPIRVESDIDRIGMYAYSIETNPDMWIRLLGEDANGALVTYDLKKSVDWSGWKYIQATLPSNTAYPLKISKLYFVDIAPDKTKSGSMSFDRILGLKKNAFNLYSKLTNKVYSDPQRGLNPSMGPVYAVAPGKALDKTLFSDMLVKQIASKLQGYDRILVTSSLKEDTLPAINLFYSYFKKTYSKDLGDVTLVKFSNKQGGLRKSSVTQWLALNALEYGVKSAGVVVLLDENPFTVQGFYEPKEFELFKKRLESIATQGKEVVVIYEGSSHGVRVENDVRYISIKKLPATLTADLKDLSYLEWAFDQGKFYYEYKPLMK